MRRTIAVLTFTAVLATAAASFTVLPDGRRVAGNTTFLVPANDGYGVGNCLAAGGECGQLVADAWCEAHGFARAASFGPTFAEDVTGAVEPVSNGNRERPIAISCAH